MTIERPIDPPTEPPLTTCPRCGVEEAVDSAGDCALCPSGYYDPSELEGFMNGKVIGVESASKFQDGVERVTICVQEADSMFNEIRLRNSLALRLDETIDVQVIRRPVDVQ